MFRQRAKIFKKYLPEQPFLEVGGPLADRLVHGVDPQLVIDSLMLKLVHRLGKGPSYPDPFQNE